MMISEFIERTGFEPTADEYAKIEEAYYNFDGDKNAFCMAFVNGNGVSRICRADRKRSATRRFKRSGPARKLGSSDLCLVCGKPYTVTSGLQKYCPDCAPDAVRAIDREQSRQWAVENTTPAQRREERQAHSAPRRCAVCGKEFVPDNASHTCSKSCQAVYARQRAKKWEQDHKEQRNQYHRELRKKKET